MKLSGDEFSVASLQCMIKDKIIKYISALHYPLSLGSKSWGGRGESIISWPQKEYLWRNRQPYGKCFFCHCTNSLYTCILNKCSSIHILKRTENIQGRLKIMIRNKELPLKKGEKLYFVLLKEQLKGDIVGDLIKPRVLQQA